MEKITHFKVGQIVNTQGLKGEVRINPSTDDMDRFDELETFYLGKNLEDKWEVEKVRYKGNMVIMKIKGINTVEEAEKLKNKFMYVPREESKDLEEGEFFIADMIGIDAYTVDGKHLGILKEVLQYSANDVYIVKDNEGKEIMIPAVMKFVPTIDMNERKMIINPIKGMLE